MHYWFNSLYIFTSKHSGKYSVTEYEVENKDRLKKKVKPKKSSTYT